MSLSDGVAAACRHRWKILSYQFTLKTLQILGRGIFYSLLVTDYSYLGEFLKPRDRPLLAAINLKFAKHRYN